MKMNVYRLFARVLNYPAPDLSEQASNCARELAMDVPLAAELLSRFERMHSEAGTARLQEIYTHTFDMQPECTPNLGYHLFGEDQRRGMFLAKLAELYREAGVDTGNELPDHLCCLLHYLATDPGATIITELMTDCLIPAVSKIANGISEPSNPYRAALDALLLWFDKECATTSASRVTSLAVNEGVGRKG